MSSDERQSAGAPVAPDDADDVLGDAFRGDGSATGPEGPDGLELDAQQSAEVRGIVVTTLPQYLEPVEQMLDVRLSGAPDAGDTSEALATTLASLRTAASRIGADDILAKLELLSDEVARLAPGVAATPSERERVFGLLAEVRGSATGVAKPEPPWGPTLFEALRGADPEERAALERLTAAGLLTVEQVRTARLDEIVAVTGLGEAVVQRLVVRLAAPPEHEQAQEDEHHPDHDHEHDHDPEHDPDPEPEREHDPEPEPMSIFGSEPDQDAEPVSAFELEPEIVASAAPQPVPTVRPEPDRPPDARSRLTAALRAQVDAEAALDEVLVDVQRLRVRTAQLRERLAAAEQRTGELTDAVAHAEASIAEQARTLERLQARKAELEVQRLAHHETRMQQERSRAELRARKEAARKEQAILDRAVRRLEDRLGKLLRPRRPD